MRYQWSAINGDGELVQGVGRSISKMFMRYQLRMQRLLPVAIRVSTIPILDAKERKQLLEQLAMLLGANIPLLQALEFMAEDQTIKRGRQLLQLAAHRVLVDGSALSDVLQELNIIDAMQFQLVQAGEASGRLCTVLEQLVAELNAEELRRRKMRKLLSYPTVLLLVTFVVAGIFLHYILPQFAELFNSMQLDLPMITRLILHIADLVKSYGMTAGLTVAVCVFSLYHFYHHSNALRRYVDRKLLCCPYLGNVINCRSMQRIFATLALLLSAGIHLVPALALLKNMLANSSYQEAISKARGEVVGGLEFHQALHNTALFESSAIQFVMIGERSGQLSEIAAKLGYYYDQRLVELLGRLEQMLEPAIILLLGVVIGTLVLGMYLPIFRLGEVVR